MRAGMRLDEQEWWGSAFENGVEVQTGTQPANFVRVWRENFHQGLERQRTVQNAGMNGSNGLSAEVNFIPQKNKGKTAERGYAVYGPGSMQASQRTVSEGPASNAPPVQFVSSRGTANSPPPLKCVQASQNQ